MTQKYSKEILLLGSGYVLSELAKCLPNKNILCLVRSEKSSSALENLGLSSLVLNLPSKNLKDVLSDLDSNSVIIDSIPPPKDDPTSVSKCIFESVPKNLTDKVRIIYLSSTSVYGNTSGEIVTEDSPPSPDSTAGENRLLVEEFYRANFKNVTSLRISGIYGPKRGIGLSLKQGYHYFKDLSRISNRIHRDDIVRFILKLIENPLLGHHVFNISDDLPMTCQSVIEIYKSKFDIPVNLEVRIAESHRSSASKAVCNSKMKGFLGGDLLFPTLNQGAGAEFID